MAYMIRKTFRAVVKAFDEKAGTIDMLIPVSTEALDRHGEVIAASAWAETIKEFMKRPILVSSHDYHTGLIMQIGEFVSLQPTDGGLIGQPKYYINMGNAEADWGFKLASMGMAAYSVGFIPNTWEDSTEEGQPSRTYTNVELLEISQVIVPSNRDAIQHVRAKSVDPVVNKLLDDTLATIPAKKYTQSEIKDECDFLSGIIEECGVAEDTKPFVLKLKDLIMRLTGGDMPDDINNGKDNHMEIKAGAKYSAKTKEVIKGLHEVVKGLEADHMAHHKAHKGKLAECRGKIEALLQDAEITEEGKAAPNKDEVTFCNCEDCEIEGCKCEGADCKDEACECACHKAKMFKMIEQAIKNSIKRGK